MRYKLTHTLPNHFSSIHIHIYHHANIHKTKWYLVYVFLVIVGRSATLASVWREIVNIMIIWWWLWLLMGRFPDCKLSIYAVASLWVVYWQHPQIIDMENYKSFIKCVFHFDWLTVIILSCDRVSSLDLLFLIISTTHLPNELSEEGGFRLTPWHCTLCCTIYLLFMRWVGYQWFHNKLLRCDDLICIIHVSMDFL